MFATAFRPVMEAMLQIALTGEVFVLCSEETTLLLQFSDDRLVTGELVFVEVGVVLPPFVPPFSAPPPFIEERFVSGVLLLLPGVARS